MKPRRLLAHLRRDDLANVRFSDFKRLAEVAAVLLNLQDVDGRAKACQIRQSLRTVAEHGLFPEGFE